jgi:hypothetical protein
MDPGEDFDAQKTHEYESEYLTSALMFTLETISRYWTQLNKERTSRDTMQVLKYPDTVDGIWRNHHVHRREPTMAPPATAQLS